MDEIKKLHEQGAIGEFALHFYDTHGKLVDSDIENRIIGIGWDELKEINPVIAIAGGTDKITAIFGALRGGFVNVLITDHQTASRLLEYSQTN